VGKNRSTLIASALPCYKYKGRATTQFAYDDGTDHFDMATNLEATWNAAPRTVDTAFGDGTLTLRHSSTFIGWRFTADPASAFLGLSALGTLNSCRPSYALDQGATPGIGVFDKPLVFDELITPAAINAVFGSCMAWGSSAPDCTAGPKLLPAPKVCDFDLTFDHFQEVDVAKGRLTAGESGLPGPVYAARDYPKAGDVTNFWCYAAITQDSKGNDLPASKVCP
jgi:hypothetical protein